MMTARCAVAILLAGVLCQAQPPNVLLLKQARDGDPAQNLSAAEFSSLGDPFFNLVLKERADATTLSAIEDLLQPDVLKRQTFVVDEDIASPRPGQMRRAVLAFSGTNGSQVLDTNVMLSVSFSSEDFPNAQRFVEAWGWDNHRGRYNYYKLDKSGTPDLRLSWKFRGSSDDADLLSPADRTGTCMACHVGGAPVMKELLLPWNNWHSFSSPASYLTQSSPALARWKVSADQHLKSLRGAEDLETSMLAAITQFNTRRLNRSVARDDSTGNIAVDAAGRSKVKEGPRLLRPLFVTTEYNLASARQKSGLHPSVQGTGPVQAVQIPTTFFLNASVLAGGGPAQHVGLGVAKAREFGSFSITAPEYAAAVRAAGLRLSGLQGDADFAWLVPEPSHIDTDMVDRLIRRGVISPQFVAAVSSVDLESPVFSEERASLLRFVPNEFDFAPAAGAHPDDLTTKVLAAVAASNPAAGSAEARFAEALRSSDPLKLLADRVAAYHSRVAAALNGPNTRRVEIERLFSRLAAVRRAALEDETLRHLNETGDRLLPIP